MKILQNKVSEFIEKYNLQNKTIIVGFSGGFDSMCLLDILSTIKYDFEKMEIIAAHFNHNWRGVQALQEQEICNLFATSRGFEFFTKTANENIKKTELEARKLRYEFFEDACDVYDSDAVFTAHNKDDNAETVLYRIIKGTGINGLKGIPEKRDKFYRPLLTTSRKEIEDYCCKKNLIPNVDSSNCNLDYTRNYIRLNILPAMEKINPEVKDALNNLALNAVSDNEIIDNTISTIKEEIYNGNKIISEEYYKLSKPLKLRILYDFITKENLEYDSKKINQIYRFLEKNLTQRNGSTLSLTTNRWLYADEKIIEVIPQITKSVDIKDLFELEIKKLGIYNYKNKIFKIDNFDNSEELFVLPEASSNFAYVDLTNFKYPLTLRTRRDGDVITPYGMNGSMKLKKYLNSKGIPRHKRDNVLLLCKDNEVLWASGIGINDKIKVIDKPKHIISLN